MAPAFVRCVFDLSKAEVSLAATWPYLAHAVGGKVSPTLAVSMTQRRMRYRCGVCGDTSFVQA